MYIQVKLFNLFLSQQIKLSKWLAAHPNQRKMAILFNLGFWWHAADQAQ